MKIFWGLLATMLLLWAIAYLMYALVFTLGTVPQNFPNQHVQLIRENQLTIALLFWALFLGSMIGFIQIIQSRELE